MSNRDLIALLKVIFSKGERRHHHHDSWLQAHQVVVATIDPPLTECAGSPVVTIYVISLCLVYKMILVSSSVPGSASPSSRVGDRMPSDLERNGSALLFALTINANVVM